jgi:hypothetical protein
MAVLQINWSPDRRILRQFGWIAFVVGVLGGVSIWRGWWLAWLVDGHARPLVAAVVAAVGLLSGAASVAWPAANKPLFIALTVVGYPIGFVVSMVAMTALFYLVVTPVGLIMRAVGKDPLHRGINRAMPSYWADARAQRPKADYFRQY